MEANRLQFNVLNLDLP